MCVCVCDQNGLTGDQLAQSAAKWYLYHYRECVIVRHGHSFSAEVVCLKPALSCHLALPQTHTHTHTPRASVCLLGLVKLPSGYQEQLACDFVCVWVGICVFVSPCDFHIPVM